MGKNPAFQFYPSDWTRDLDDLDIQIEGAWIRVLCRLWWASPKGQATNTLKEWSRILRKTERKTNEILKILIEKGIADGSVLDNQNVTIISRRMVRDFEISQLRKQVGKLGGNPKLIKNENRLDNQTDNQNLTPSSSSSTSNTKNKKNTAKAAVSFSQDFERFYTAYPKRVGKKSAYAEWNKATRPPVEAILSALEKQKRAKEELRQTGQFVSEWPDPERWIKKERWNDEITSYQKTPENPSKAGDSPFAVCPKCGKETLKNLIDNNGCNKCVFSEIPEEFKQAMKGGE